MDSDTQFSRHRPICVKLWPPSQGTRLMLVERMTKNMITPSIISRKYGLLSKEEAEVDARNIEEQAFDLASQQYEKELDGDGSSAVQLYAKESSRLMLDVLKRGPRVKEEGNPISVDEIDWLKATSFDISGGRRAFINAEEAEDLLKPLMETGNTFTKICFSNRSFGLDAAAVVEPILSSIKHQLTEVDLSDIVAGRSESEALEVMKIFSSALEGCNLKYLNLSNNALGEKGVRAFSALLSSLKNLEELHLINDGISEEAASAVRELIPSTAKLRVLHFHNNMTGDEGAISISEIIKGTTSLEDFRCSSTRVGSEGGVALAEALGLCTHLKKLDLRDNMFGIAAGIALSKSIPAFKDLTNVYLSYLNLEDEGAEALCNAFKENAPSLQVLEMAGNEITAKGAVPLAACILLKRFLISLNLAENELKDEGAILIAKAIENDHENLIEVDLSNNGITRVGARSIAMAVVTTKEFKLLNINGNFISDNGVDEIQALFKNCPQSLGPFDENDPDGEDYQEEEEEEEENIADELELKFKSLEIKHDDAGSAQNL